MKDKIFVFLEMYANAGLLSSCVLCVFFAGEFLVFWEVKEYKNW